MRSRTLLLTTAVTLALAAGAEAGSNLKGVTRVRPVNDKAASLLADAQQKSETVRNLIKQLDKGDVVAFVQVVSPAERGPQSTMRFVGASKLARFVLIQVAECEAPCRRAELLGHELQHVNEVAASSWITDDHELQRLLMLRGYLDSGSARGYETAAAMQAERNVRREVRGISSPAQ
jgi:hypothetical protein